MSRHLGWLAAAAGLGFAVPALFSGLLGLERDPYLLVYLPVIGGFTAAYLRGPAPAGWTRVRGRWLRGTVVGLAAGALLVLSVLRQPAGAPAEGAALVLDLAWSGVAYGLVDALLLTVLPVAAVFGALGGSAGRAGGGATDGAAGGDGGSLGRAAATAALALAASLAVTAAYHLGYEEFRGTALVGPLVGNAVVTVAYLAARSPVAPVVAHVAMHVAAVLHGMEAAVQLPPHG